MHIYYLLDLILGTLHQIDLILISLLFSDHSLTFELIDVFLMIIIK